MEFLSISIIGGGKEQLAFEILKKNARAVTDVVKKFNDFISAYFTDLDFNRAEKMGRELSRLETAADKGKRQFMKVLSEGAFLPSFRADLAWLAERLDTVADTAEGAMRVLLLRKQLLQTLIRGEKKNKALGEWRLGFVKMAKVTTQTVQTLEEAIGALSADISGATRKANDVELLEHEIDLMEHSLMNELYNFEKLLDPVSIIQLADFIRRSANVSDRAEDTCDTLIILGFTLRG
ncbi:MAG: TIGR00153 family protein [Candidatus Hadarchaeaceae archaeon]